MAINSLKLVQLIDLALPSYYNLSWHKWHLICAFCIPYLPSSLVATTMLLCLSAGAIGFGLGATQTLWLTCYP